MYWITPGIDNIHILFLKHGGLAILESLVIVFQASWEQGKLPDIWKWAKITPIPKPGRDRLNPKKCTSNISHLSCMQVTGVNH